MKKTLIENVPEIALHVQAAEQKRHILTVQGELVVKLSAG
jgi:hypothetical protein